MTNRKLLKQRQSFCHDGKRGQLLEAEAEFTGIEQNSVLYIKRIFNLVIRQMYLSISTSHFR